MAGQSLLSNKTLKNTPGKLIVNRATHWHCRRLLAAGLLIASTQAPARSQTPDVQSLRLPPVSAPPAGVAAQESHSGDAEAPSPSVEGLFQSFQKKRAEREQPARHAFYTGSKWSQPIAENATPQRWLRSSSSSASLEVARRLIGQASEEYAIGAWASAETSAWESLRYAAEGVELAARESGQPNGSPALANLRIARTAIREARDFGGMYGDVDQYAIGRMVTSHQTTLLDSESLAGLTAADAIDRYLDEARIRLAGIAADSVEAAQAMDLLAAIYLGRADSKTLPSSTALCLRRAALQGQPRNASLSMRLGMHLADLGLYQEARWALEHSLRLQPSEETVQALAGVLRRTGHDQEAGQLLASLQNRAPAGSSVHQARVPDVTELSPQEFAAVSKPVNKPASKGNFITGTLASAKQNIVRIVTPETDSPESADRTSVQDQNASSPSATPEPPKKPSIVRRFFNALIPVW